jgi:hypothetical protein
MLALVMPGIGIHGSVCALGRRMIGRSVDQKHLGIEHKAAQRTGGADSYTL